MVCLVYLIKWQAPEISRPVYIYLGSNIISTKSDIKAWAAIDKLTTI